VKLECTVVLPVAGGATAPRNAEGVFVGIVPGGTVATREWLETFGAPALWADLVALIDDGELRSTIDWSRYAPIWIEADDAGAPVVHIMT
jgi:hypothetical protein